MSQPDPKTTTPDSPAQPLYAQLSADYIQRLAREVAVIVAAKVNAAYRVALSGTTSPPISSMTDHVGGSCEDGYLVQFILTDEAQYIAWMAWLRDQRIKALESVPVFYGETKEATDEADAIAAPRVAAP